MNSFLNSKNLKYVYIVVSVIMVLSLFANITVLFVKAWFTSDEQADAYSTAANVDVAIFENNTVPTGLSEFIKLDLI